MNNIIKLGVLLLLPTLSLTQPISFCGDGDVTEKNLLTGVDIQNYNFTRDISYIRVSLNMIRACDTECEGIPISRVTTVLNNLSDYLDDYDIEIALVNNDGEDCDDYDYVNHICFLDEYYDNYIGGLMPIEVDGYQISYPTSQDRSNLWALNFHEDAIDIYFLPDDIWNIGRTATYPVYPSTGLAVGGRFANDPITIFTETDVTSHEFGHCLGLFHTFDGFCTSSDCREFVNTYPTNCDEDCEDNCTLCGDMICDTQADPNFDFLINNGNFSIFHTSNFDPETHCIYTGDITQEYLDCDDYLTCANFDEPGSGCIEGGTYDPDTFNLMAYTHPYCWVGYSSEQGQRMRVMLEEHETLIPVTFLYGDGDVNRDDDLNILDIVLIVGYILDNIDFDEEQVYRADYNEDDTINVSDVVGVIQEILDDTENYAPDGTVFITKTIKAAGNPPYVMEIKMINEPVVKGMQMSVELDAGYKAISVKRGEYADSSGMSLGYKISQDSTEVSYLYYGPDGEEFPADSLGIILKLGMIYQGSPRSVFNAESGHIANMIFANSANYELDHQELSNDSFNEIINDEYNPNSSMIISEFRLHSVFPNPFNPITAIQYDLPEPSHVSITIFDIGGREVIQLVNAVQEAGYHSVQWDASGYASGAYFVKMTAGDFTQTQKITVMK